MGVGWHCADVGEGDGQAGRGAEIAAALQLKMQVWLGGVAGIATAGDALAARDRLADVHIDAARLEMTEQRIDAAAVVQEHEISAQIVCRADRASFAHGAVWRVGVERDDNAIGWR